MIERATRRTTGLVQAAGRDFKWDKKTGEDYHWRDACAEVKSQQASNRRSSWSQDYATIDFSHVTKPIKILPLGDLQIGSWGTDYSLLEEFTDTIMNNNLYVGLVGDLGQFAIKMRGVLEMMDNALTPKMQIRFLESWFHDIAPRCLWHTWSNHDSNRFEDTVGFDVPAELFNRKVLAFNHIGHLDLLVGGEEYKIATSHYFKGKATETNPANGLQKYLRITAPDREIAIAGDTHRPVLVQWFEGGSQKTAINCGTIQTDSGYAKRYFTLKTCPAFPCMVLRPDRHEVVPFWNVNTMLESYPE